MLALRGARQISGKRVRMSITMKTKRPTSNLPSQGLRHGKRPMSNAQLSTQRVVEDARVRSGLKEMTLAMLDSHATGVFLNHHPLIVGNLYDLIPIGGPQRQCFRI